MLLNVSLHAALVQKSVSHASQVSRLERLASNHAIERQNAAPEEHGHQHLCACLRVQKDRTALLRSDEGWMLRCMPTVLNSHSTAAQAEGTSERPVEPTVSQHPAAGGRRAHLHCMQQASFAVLGLVDGAVAQVATADVDHGLARDVVVAPLLLRDLGAARERRGGHATGVVLDQRVDHLHGVSRHRVRARWSPTAKRTCSLDTTSRARHPRKRTRTNSR